MDKELAESIEKILMEFGVFCCDNGITELDLARDHFDLLEAIQQADHLLKMFKAEKNVA